MGQIKPTEIAEIYKKISEESLKKDETNDCTLKAVSIATGVSYEEVHKVVKENGRKDKDGTYRDGARETLKILGWRMELIDQRGFKNKFPNHHKNLKYITSHSFRRFPEAFSGLPPVVMVFTADHVFTVMDGKNCDWSADNKLRTKGIYRIVPGLESLSEMG